MIVWHELCDNIGMAQTSESMYFTAHRSPSVEVLCKTFTLSKEVAERVKGIMTGTVDLMTCPAAIKRQAEAYNSHSGLTLALEAVNELIGAYGPEYVAHRSDGYTESSLEGFHYFNFGDTYDTTILVSAQGQNWTIGSWGDRVEANPYKYV